MEGKLNYNMWYSLCRDGLRQKRCLTGYLTIVRNHSCYVNKVMKWKAASKLAWS